MIEIRNKKAWAGSFNIFTFIVVSILVVVFCAGLIFVMGKLNDVFTQVGVINEQTPKYTSSVPCINNQSAECSITSYTNISYASEMIWGQTYSSMKALRIVALSYLLAYAVGIMIIGFFERKHPVLFFVYIIITLIGVIFAPIISNAYEDLLNSGLFENELQNFTAINFIMLNLPTIVLIIGIVGAIGLFVNLLRTGEEGGNVSL